MIRAHQILEQHTSAGIFHCAGSSITVDFVDQLCASIDAAQKFDCSAISDDLLDDRSLYAAGRAIIQGAPAALPADISYYEFGRPICALCIREADHVAVFAFIRPPGQDWNVSHCYTRFEANHAPVLSMGRAVVLDLQQAAAKAANLAASFLCSVIGLIDAGRIDKTPSESFEALNKQRIKQGRLPLFSHTIVTIPGSHTHAPSIGTHSSPRLHFRRGHMRRLPTGKRVPIKGTLVGDPARGFVSHDYVAR